MPSSPGCTIPAPKECMSVQIRPQERRNGLSQVQKGKKETRWTRPANDWKPEVVRMRAAGNYPAARAGGKNNSKRKTLVEGDPSRTGEKPAPGKDRRTADKWEALQGSSGLGGSAETDRVFGEREKEAGQKRPVNPLCLR